MTRFSEETERVLRAAGWSPERRVDITQWRDRLRTGGFEVHPAAEAFLSEFGGLAVDISGAGISRAREPFALDPMLAWGEDERYSEWGELVGRSICPVGELDHGRFFLGIDEVGEIYLVADWLARFGPVPDALENLVLGVAPEPVSMESNDTG